MGFAGDAMEYSCWNIWNSFYITDQESWSDEKNNKGPNVVLV